MIKFKDSNFITVANHPEVEVGASQTIKLGCPYTVKANKTVVATETDKDLHIALNIIDKPEVLNTEEFVLKTGDKARDYRMKDLVGFTFEMSENLVTDDYASVTVGKTFVVDTATGGWKVGTIPAGGVGFEVLGKNTFGMFTVDKDSDVKGGFDVQVVLA